MQHVFPTVEAAAVSPTMLLVSKQRQAAQLRCRRRRSGCSASCITRCGRLLRACKMLIRTGTLFCPARLWPAMLVLYRVSCLVSYSVLLALHPGSSQLQAFAASRSDGAGDDAIAIVNSCKSPGPGQCDRLADQNATSSGRSDLPGCAGQPPATTEETQVSGQFQMLSCAS